MSLHLEAICSELTASCQVCKARSLKSSHTKKEVCFLIQERTGAKHLRQCPNPLPLIRNFASVLIVTEVVPMTRLSMTVMTATKMMMMVVSIIMIQTININQQSTLKFPRTRPTTLLNRIEHYKDILAAYRYILTKPTAHFLPCLLRG